MLPLLLEFAGASVVLFALHQVFRDIFHPTRSGSLSDFIGWLASKLMRYTRIRPAIGPIALVAVILCWVVLLAAGFALIYCGLVRQGLLFDRVQQDASLGHCLLFSTKLSLGSLDTFQTFGAGFRSGWVPLLVTIEGLLGLMMITASVSWLVLLYPALARIRFLGRRVSILCQMEQRLGRAIAGEIGVPALTGLTDQFVQFRIDLVLFPILLNFYPADPRTAIARFLPWLWALSSDISSQSSSQLSSSQVRFAALQLQLALEELGSQLAEHVRKEARSSTQDVFLAYQKDER